MKKVAIINYKMGNIDSVARAVEKCGAHPCVTSKAGDIKEASSIILPGVGAFIKGMQMIKKLDLFNILNEEVMDRKTPILGICLGMQLFATRGYEGEETSGFNWIEGAVKRLEPDGGRRSIPHIGWNEVTFLKEDAIFENIPSRKDFYFVHSYNFICKNQDCVIAETDYCGKFITALRKDNIVGVQFHPEKSQYYGLQLMRNFLSF